MRRDNHISDKEEKTKLDFFWGHCMPEIEEDVLASIRKKTFCKIQEDTNTRLQLNRKKNRLKIYTIATASVAASIALLFLFTPLFENKYEPENLKEIVALMNLDPVDETEDVVLVMSEVEKLQVATDAQISYTPQGNVSVGSEELKSEKAAEENKKSLQDAYNQLIVPKGKRSQLLLSDGTKVWVNAGTKVVYPRVFNEKRRDIYVDGEVYLEVTHDANRPFYVNTDGFEVKVLGTSFDVMAYKHQATSKVVLVDGKVEIKDQQNRQMQMKPNELVALQHNSITEKTTVNASDYKAWIDGILILKGDYLYQLAERLNLLYGTSIVCDPSLLNEQVYGKLDLRDNLEEIIDYIKSMIPLTAREEGGTIYLSREK